MTEQQTYGGYIINNRPHILRLGEGILQIRQS